MREAGIRTYAFFNLLGIGCVLAAIISGSSPADVPFLVILGGLWLSCLGMGSVAVLTEKRARRHRELLALHRAPQDHP